MRRMVAVLLSLGCLGTLSFAQQAAVSPAAKDATGTVVGHVYCGDTNAPARLASITLEPARDVSDFSSENEEKRWKQVISPISSISTNLDGTFVIPRVKPGTYYLVVEKSGYVSSLALFSAEDLESPTPEIKQKIEKSLRKVTVEANQTSSVEIRLERGASISGTVSFDDGSPADGLIMKLLRKDKDGTWKLFPLGARGRFWEAARTDDRGHYRIVGLPTGEYMVQTDLAITEVKYSNFLVGRGGSSSSNIKFSLPIYSGGSTRKKDAATFKLQEGEDRAGEDIVIPLAKFHTVSGTVVASHDGHQVNAGRVSLLFADDKSTLITADIDKEDNAFHFQYVPEGDYILEIKNARDVNREEIMNPPGTMPPSQTKETELHAYGTGDQPLSLHGETNGVVIAVPEKNTKSATASAQ